MTKPTNSHIERVKKCKQCKQPFVPFQSTQKVCGWHCAQLMAIGTREKLERRQILERKSELKTLPKLKKECQIAFNGFIRARDRNQLCICCDKPLGNGDIGGSYDCGHYRSVGSAAHLRFDERNAHAQRKVCNRYGSGRAVDYRMGLIRRIGLQAVVELDNDNEPRHYTKDQLREMAKMYRAKTRLLLKDGQ